MHIWFSFAFVVQKYDAALCQMHKDGVSESFNDLLNNVVFRPTKEHKEITFPCVFKKI